KEILSPPEMTSSTAAIGAGFRAARGRRFVPVASAVLPSDDGKLAAPGGMRASRSVLTATFVYAESEPALGAGSNSVDFSYLPQSETMMALRAGMKITLGCPSRRIPLYRNR